MLIDDTIKGQHRLVAPSRLAENVVAAKSSEQLPPAPSGAQKSALGVEKADVQDLGRSPAPTRSEAEATSSRKDPPRPQGLTRSQQPARPGSAKARRRKIVDRACPLAEANSTRACARLAPWTCPACTLINQVAVGDGVTHAWGADAYRIDTHPQRALGDSFTVPLRRSTRHWRVRSVARSAPRHSLFGMLKSVAV